LFAILISILHSGCPVPINRAALVFAVEGEHLFVRVIFRLSTLMKLQTTKLDEKWFFEEK